ASSGATSYQVQVSTSSSFTTTVVNQSGITSTSYAVSGLINNTVYYWRVNATNASGTSAYSSNWSFTTIVGAPSAPTLLSPSNAATGVSIPPTLNWNASTGATSYQLQVSTSSSFTTTVVNQSGITATSYAVSGLNNNTVYYWRVNATNAGGTSAYSSNWSFTTSISHGIVLPQGWSLISSVAMPPDLTLSTVLAKIIPHIELMKDAAGQVFWPALSINTIGTWDYHEGYQVHMLSADTLTITGSEIRPEATPVPLVQGVNLVPYLRHSPMQVDSALASVLNNLVIAKDNAGNVYWPSFGINSIGAMKPSQGYQVQVSQACTLVYPANASPGPPTILAKQGGPVNSSEIPSPLHYRLQTSNTGANAVLLVEGCKLKDGDEIAAWTTRKALVGSGVMSQGRALLTIWGDNTATEDVTEGATEGEPLSLTFWSAAEQKEGSLTVSSLLDAVTSAKAANSLCYKTDAVWVAQATQVVELPKAFSLSQNYPNPFNPSTVIRYALPKDAMVTLEIFNILGQRVALAVNEEQKAGNHEVIFQNSTLGSGIYFCRLTAGEFTATKKMVLIR
ncbi:MAG: T9SS type A sorting domain-containing protein, partial [Bacteroidota bacterium]